MKIHNMIKSILLMVCAVLALSGCSCKEWGYCPEIFPNAERLADTPDNK